VVTFSVVLLVLVAATVLTLLFEHWVPVTPRLALYGLASGFFVVLGHFFVFMAFRLTTARTVAPFYYAFTPFAALFGAVFFGEWPNPLALIGIAMIVACGLAVLLFERKDVKS
jgi:drug/metabolite transporter (DMT)-like permease